MLSGCIESFSLGFLIPSKHWRSSFGAKLGHGPPSFSAKKNPTPMHLRSSPPALVASLPSNQQSSLYSRSLDAMERSSLGYSIGQNRGDIRGKWWSRGDTAPPCCRWQPRVGRGGGSPQPTRHGRTSGSQRFCCLQSATRPSTKSIPFLLQFPA
jgi:hypothetical protein